MNWRVHLIVAEKTFIKSAQPKNHPALNTLGLTKLRPNAEQANGSAAQVKQDSIRLPSTKTNKVNQKLLA